MRIVMNAIPLLTPLTGVGNYAFQIARALKGLDQINVYTYFYGYYSRELRVARRGQEAFSTLKSSALKIPLLRTLARKSRNLLSSALTKRFDLYFEPNFIPLSIPARHVVATIPDFSFARFPEWHPRERVRYFEKEFWKKIKRADRNIVISEFIRQEAIDLFGFSPEKLSTIHLGYDPSIFRVYPLEDLASIRERYSLPKKFLLFVGSIEPRKNLKNLLLAYAQLAPKLRREFKLVLIGFKGWENEEIQTSMKKMEGDVRYTGYVPEEDLGKIYNLARVFVYPSFYEGFGLPPLEAMASGCPVIVSRTSSLPEVCGNAAHYVDPHDVDDISTAMERILLDEQISNSLKTLSLARAQIFSWQKSASEHLALFESEMKAI
jgi:glycosyltransferase involved in cell wall biosynthesis